MPTGGTVRDVDTRPLLHPLRHAFWLRRWCCHLAQGLAAQGQGGGFAAVSQHAVMTDTNEARGQDMHQKAFDEGMGMELHDF